MMRRIVLTSLIVLLAVIACGCGGGSNAGGDTSATTSSLSINLTSQSGNVTYTDLDGNARTVPTTGYIQLAVKPNTDLAVTDNQGRTMSKSISSQGNVSLSLSDAYKSLNNNIEAAIGAAGSDINSLDPNAGQGKKIEETLNNVELAAYESGNFPGGYSQVRSLIATNISNFADVPQWTALLTSAGNTNAATAAAHIAKVASTILNLADADVALFVSDYQDSSNGALKALADLRTSSNSKVISDFAASFVDGFDLWIRYSVLRGTPANATFNSNNGSITVTLFESGLSLPNGSQLSIYDVNGTRILTDIVAPGNDLNGSLTYTGFLASDSVVTFALGDSNLNKAVGLGTININ